MRPSSSRDLETLVALYGEELRQVDWKRTDGRPLGRPVGWRLILAYRPEWGLTRRDAKALVAWLQQGAPALPPPASAPEPAVFREGAKTEVDWERDDEEIRINARGQGLVMSVEDYVRVANIDTSVWRVVEAEGGTWTTAMNQRLPNGKSRPVITRNWKVAVKMFPRLEERALAAVEAGATYPRPVGRAAGQVVTTLVIPDSQCGYRWSGVGRERRLHAIHDEAAMDVTVQAAKRLQPDRILLLGDMADFAELSTKFARPPDLLDTTNVTILALHRYLRALREAAPRAEIIYLEGNHEARLRNMLVEKASALADLRVAGDEQPLVTVPRLLRLDDLAVDYIAPYGETFWLNDTLGANHGLKVRRKGGATATAVLAESSFSMLFGHVHRRELATKTIHGPWGRREVWAATPGCLCRIDGEVPGAAGRPDWQQGFSVVVSDPGDGDAGGEDHIEMVAIQNGRAYFRGTWLYGVDTSPPAA